MRRDARRLAIVVAGVFLISPGGARAAATAPAGHAVDFVVAPTGDDANPGTAQQPFASLDRARLAVRHFREKTPNRDITVLLRGGTYRLNRTVVFSLEDAASAGHSITYAAWPGESPVFSAGLPVEGWQKVAEPVPGEAQAAVGKLWSAPVPSMLKSFSVLFDGSRRLPRARGPGFVSLPATDCQAHGAHLHHLHCPPGVLPAWSSARNWELVAVPIYPWVVNILPISRVEENGRIVQTDVPATYSLEKTKFGHFPKGSAWIENAIECLDAPGEWVFDAAERRILLWPPSGQPSREIVAPLLTELIRIEGRIDAEGPADEPVRGIVFRGLTFTHGDRQPWSPDKTGRGLQHDWEMFDRPTALVRLRGAEECRIEDCRFVNSGSTAIRLDLHAQRNTVKGNQIAHLGGVGVLLAGYGPGTKDVNRGNEVSGNHIHHIGELLWHSPAIFVWQSGENRIARNLIHHCPYTAIVVSGRIVWDRRGQGECSRTIRWSEVDQSLAPTTQRTWAVREPFLHGRGNIVEGNEISQVMEILGDGNCIYVSGTGGGNVVRNNYLHNVDSPNMNAAIRCDDDQHGTVVTRNIVWRTCGEGFINKGNNTFTNNIVAELRACGREGRSPRGFLVLPYGEVAGAVIQRNIYYSTDKSLKLLFEGRNTSRPPVFLRDCSADHNLYFCTEDPHWAQAHLREQCGHGVECGSIEADPRFVDVSKGDFRLQPDSPALSLGFEPIAVERLDRNSPR
jgi:hypothetical protein